MFAVAALIAYCANPAFRSPEDGLPAGALSRIGPVTLARPVRTSEATFLYPDGSYAVIAPTGVGPTVNRPPAEWWDLTKGRRVPPPLPLPAGTAILGIGPAGLITSTEAGYHLRDLRTGAVRFGLPGEGVSFEPGRRGGLSPVFDVTASLAVARVAGQVTIHRRRPDGSVVGTKLPITLDGQWALAGRGGAIAFANGNEVKRYDVGTGETRTIVSCKEPHSIAYSVDISPDGSVVAVVRRDRNYDLPAIGELYFGNDPTPKPLAEPKADVGVGRVWFTPDGKEIYTVSNRSAVAWDAATGAVVAEYQSERTNRLTASADGRRLLGTDYHGRLNAVDWRKAGPPPDFPRRVTFAGVRWVGERTAVAWGYADPAGPGQTMRGWAHRWDATTKAPTVTALATDETDYWSPVALSPDGTRLVVSLTREDKGLYRVLDAATRTVIASWADETNDGFAGPFSLDGKLLLARKNGQTGLYTPDGAKCLVTFQATAPRRGGGRGFAWSSATPQFSPDGRLVYACGTGGLTAIETATGTVRYTLFGTTPVDRRAEGGSAGITLSGDGRRMVFDGRGRMSLVDPTTGTVLRPIELPSARGRFTEDGGPVALSRTGRWLAAASAVTQDVLLYDLDALPTPDLVHSFRGATGSVTALAFRADDRALVSVSSDGTAVTWDVGTALDRLTRKAENDPVATWWDDLAADATRAGKAMAAMTTKFPDRAVTLLAERLTPPDAVSESALKKWVEELDHPDPAVRETAFATLKPVADQAEAVLRATLAKAPSAEVRKRVTALIESLEGPETDPIRLRGLRAVEVLERIGTPAAGAVLAKVAKGPPGAALTRAAKEAMGRAEWK